MTRPVSSPGRRLTWWSVERLAGGWKIGNPVRGKGISVWDRSLIGAVRRWRRVNL